MPDVLDPLDPLDPLDLMEVMEVMDLMDVAAYHCRGATFDGSHGLQPMGERDLTPCVATRRPTPTATHRGG